MTHYISNSEVADFNKCERLHFYKYILGLTKEDMSGPLACGIYGHEVISIFYNELIDGKPWQLATALAFKHLDSLQGEIDHEVWNILNLHLIRYFKKHHDKPYRPISSEKTYKVELPDRDYGFAFKVDLIAEITIGKHAGKLAAIDHKFTYNFWGLWKLKMYAQLPRYIWGAKFLGLDVDLGIVAQIRYRQFKDLATADLFAHEFIETTDAENEAFMKEFKKTADLAYARHLMPVQMAEDTARRATNYACESCPFQDPCRVGLTNKSEEVRRLKANFVKSTYGYNNGED